MLAVDLDPAKPGDYGDRHNTPVDTLILHTTEGGSIEGATRWHDREEVVASAHYFLDGRAGRIVQRVPEGLAAYAAGNRLFNRRAVQIEVVGHANARGTWTPETLALLVALAAEIVARHAIPVRRMVPGIIGHADVPHPRVAGLLGGASGHTDPGPFFPWADFIRDVRNELAALVASGPVGPAELVPIKKGPA